MTYYEQLLPNGNRARTFAKRFFLWLGIVHFASGAVFVVLGALINWRFAIVPALWFLWGFVPANIGYLFEVDYKYVYDHGVLTIWRHRRFGDYQQVCAIPCAEIEWSDLAPRRMTCTNCTPTVHFVYKSTLYSVSTDAYLTAMMKGEHYVFGQCGDNGDASVC